MGVGPKRQTVIGYYVQLLFRVMEHELDFSSTLWIRALYAIMISKKQEAKNQCSIQTTLTLWRTITMRIIRPNWFLSFFLIYFKIFYFLTGRVVQNSLSRIGQCWHFWWQPKCQSSTLPWVAGGGEVARVKFFTETAALLAIFRITRRIFPNFPGSDSFTTIDGHLKAPRVS